MKKLILFFTIIPTIISAQNINTVTSQQNGNKINIKYNLKGLASDEMVRVNLYYSLNEAEYVGPLNKVKGDVGEFVSGNGTKTITWNVLSEIGSLKGDTKFKVELIPSITKEKPSASSKDIDGYIDKCQIDGTTLTVDFILEPKINKAYYFSTHTTAIFDGNGEKYSPDSFKWGNKTGTVEKIEVMEKVPFKIRFIFTNIDSSIKQLNGALLSDNHNKFTLRFKKTPVLKVN